MGTADAAIIRGLRRTRNEPQMTQALAGLFTSEPAVAAAFVRLLLEHLGADAAGLPPELACTAEEGFSEGRVDLRFRGGEWNVIAELKIAAGTA